MDGLKSWISHIFCVPLPQMSSLSPEGRNYVHKRDEITRNENLFWFLSSSAQGFCPS